MRETELMAAANDQSDDLAYIFWLNNRHLFYKAILEKENDSLFDELLSDLRRGLKIIKEKKINDPALNIFLNENLTQYITKMLERNYINPRELIIQIKTNEFFQDCLIMCLEGLEANSMSFFEIIRKIYNIKHSFYVIYSYKNLGASYDVDFKDIVLERMRNYNIEKYEAKQKILSDTKFGFHISTDTDDLEQQQPVNKNSSEEVVTTINLNETSTKNNELNENAENREENSENQKDQENLENITKIQKNEEIPDFSIDFHPNKTKIKKDVFDQSSLSPFYIMNLTFFEKSQGIQTLLSLIHCSRSASQIIAILDFIENLWSFFEKDFLMENFNNVLEDIKLIPQKISEDEIKNSKKTEISELLHTIEFVYDKFYSPKESQQFREIMELELYLMCFKSQYLEKRIFGLSNIIGKIREAKSNQRIETNFQYKILINNASVNNYYKNGKESNLWLTSQNMLEWLERENLFDIIFGESIHIELISRSLPFLTFLYENNKLSNERLNLIFDLAHGKHEAFGNPVTKILLELIEIMNIEDLKALFSKLKQIPFNDLTHDILTMLKHILSNNRYLRSHYMPEENIASYKIPSDAKEIELKEIKQDNFSISFTDYDKISNSQCQQQQYKNVKVCGEEDEEQRKLWENDFKEEETKNEENIKELCPNPNEFLPLVISQQESSGKNIKKPPLINTKMEENEINADKNFELEVLNHMWNIVTSGNQINIVGEALKYMTDILSRNFSSKKIDFVHRSIESISSNICLHESLQILESIIKGSYPIQKDENIFIRNKLELVEYLEKEYALTNEILSSIIILKKSFVNYIINQNQQIPPNFNNINNDFQDEKIEKFPDDSSSIPQKNEEISEKKNKTITFQTKNQPLSSTSRKISNRLEEEKMNFQSEEEKFSSVLQQNKENDTEAKSIDLTQPTRGDKETLSISTDASSFDDLNALFEKNNRPFFDNNNYSNNKANDELGLYLKEIDVRLKFLRNLFEISLELLEVKHIKILWEVLVVNAMNDQEKDFFFNFFHSIVYSAKDKYRHMKEDVIYFIYFDILLKIDHNYYNLKAFFCFEAFFLYINKEAKLISFSEFDNYKLNNPELIGLEHVWELYLQAVDSNVSSKAGDLLIKIFKFASLDNLEIFETLKQNFVDTLINHIKIGYLELQNLQILDNNEIKVIMITRSLDLILKLIEETEGTKASQQKAGDSLQITITNQLNNAMNPKKFEVTLNSKMTLSQAKALIAKKLNPPQKPEEILFMVRGSILIDDQRTLQDLRIENKLTFFVTKQGFQDEELQQTAGTAEVSNEVIMQKVNYLKEMFGNIEEEVIKFILEKKKYNENDVAMVLLDDKSVEEYKDEYMKAEKEKFKEKQKGLGLEKEDLEKINTISHLLANRPDYFELFFEILNLEIAKLTTQTWTLLNHIPINKELHIHIKTIFSKQKFSNEKIDWSKIFNPKQPFKTLYSLQIVHSIIACGVLDEKEQLQEINERKEWREKFIEYNGFNHLYKLLFTSTISVMLPKHSSQKEENSSSLLIRYLSYIIEILKVYIHSYLLSTIPETIQKYLNQAIRFKDTLKDPSSSSDQTNKQPSNPVFHPLKFQNQHPQSLSNSYSLTPNFHSPNTSKSATPHCTTPPIIDKDGDNVSLNKSSLFNNTKDNSILYDEFVGLTRHSNEKLNDKLRSAINFENLVDKMLHILHEAAELQNTMDPDVICLIENCFEVIFPSLMGKPELLILLYNFDRLDETVTNLLTLSPNETIRKSLTYILNTISLNFQEPVFKQKLHEINAFKSQRLPDKTKEENNENLLENFINASFENLDNFEENESFGNPNNEDDEGLYEGNSFENKKTEKVQLEEPRSFFLKLLIPQIIQKKFENHENEDFFICLTGLLKQNSKEEICKIVNLQELFERIAKTLIEREVFEDRYKEDEDKILSGFLLLAKTLIEIEPAFKTLRISLIKNNENIAEKEVKSKNDEILKSLEKLENIENFIDFDDKPNKKEEDITNKKEKDIENLKENDKNDEDISHKALEILINPEKIMKTENLTKNASLSIGLVNYVYDFMFYGSKEGKELDFNDLSMPKCKKKSTRKRGFELLLELCNKCDENFLILLPLIIKNHENFQSIDYDSCNCDLKPGHGFIGLRNLGCTCYINSLIQQFYMIKEIRYCVMSCEGMTGGLDNVLCQLQSLFANLKENIKQFLIPNHLINSLKGYDNQPINVHIQQDVNEFFNLLSDKLENNFKETQYKTLLQDIIGGSLSHEIISLEEEFPYNGEREEPFYSISIEIKHKKNINEALDYYVKGETLEGENKYFCEQYNKKIKVLKRCLIKKLPNTLILTLKRFEFDYNLMQKVKINDYFEFPKSLNMRKWTKQGLMQELNNEIDDDKNYQYDLVGVLVHAGTAEAGHYYSYIKDREALSEKWYEFNDTHVLSFNSNNLRSECFGGEYENEDGAHHFGDWDGSKSKNAYLLFYEKTNPEISKIIKEVDKKVSNNLKEAIWTQNINYLKSRLFYDIDYFNFIRAFICLYDFTNQIDVKPIISLNDEQLKDLRWMWENQDLLGLTKQATYSDLYGEELNYQAPVEEINKQLDNINQNSLDYYINTPELQTIKLAITFAHDSFMKTKDIQGFLSWMHILKPLFDNYVPACFWFLNYVTSRKEMITELFFEMNYVEAKTAFAKLLIVIINNIYKREDDYLFENEYIEKIEISSDYYSAIKRIETKKSCLLRFIDMFCGDLLFECKKNLSKSLDYLQIIKYLIQLSSKIISYIVHAKILKSFLDLFLSNAPSNSYYSYQPVIIKMNDKITENHLIPLLDIISLIIRGCATTGIQRIQSFAPTSVLIDQKYCPLLDSSVEEVFLDQANYLSIFFPMQQFCEATSFITRHLAWGDLKNSRFFLNMLRDILTTIQTSWNQVEHIFRVVDGILRLEDMFQNERIQCFFEEGKYYNSALTVLEHISKMKDNEKMFTIMSIKCIAEMGSNCQACANYIRENSKKFKWMVEYLNIIPKQMVFTPQTPHLPRVIATASNKLIEILGLNALEEIIIPNKVVDIIENDSDDSDLVTDKSNPNSYLNQIEKDRVDNNNINVNYGGSDEMEIEQEKTNENEKVYKKNEPEEEEKNNEN